MCTGDLFGERRTGNGQAGRLSYEERDLPAQTWLWVCEPVVEIATQTEGDVPAYLPGEHPFKGEFETKHHLPEFAARGGAETMYPEFKERIREWLVKNPRPAPAKGK